jgi:sulfopyruvate decarboxylase subunit alpha
LDSIPKIFGEMSHRTATEVVEGMHAGGINFAAFLPESEFLTAQKAVTRDKRFQWAAVSNEGIGVAVCSGAFAGGKRPALMIGASGFPLTTYPLNWLTGCHRLPMLLLVTTRTLGDGHNIYGTATRIIEPFLRGLDIPIREVRRTDEIRRVVADAAVTCFAWMKPYAVLLQEEVIDNRQG